MHVPFTSPTGREIRGFGGPELRGCVHSLFSLHNNKDTCKLTPSQHNKTLQNPQNITLLSKSIAKLFLISQQAKLLFKSLYCSLLRACPNSSVKCLGKAFAIGHVTEGVFAKSRGSSLRPPAPREILCTLTSC